MSHKAEVIDVREAADGILAVHVRCCRDSSTDSVLTLHELARTDDEIDKDIAAHLARVENLHEARTRARVHIERLCKK